MSSAISFESSDLSYMGVHADNNSVPMIDSPIMNSSSPNKHHMLKIPVAKSLYNIHLAPGKLIEAAKYE